MEAELELEEPMEFGGTMSASKDKGDRGVVVTLSEHHEPMATSVDGGRDTKTHGNVLESRKSATSEETTVEREAKRVRSPCPLDMRLLEKVT